jgi:hypothetical protein
MWRGCRGCWGSGTAVAEPVPADSLVPPAKLPTSWFDRLSEPPWRRTSYSVSRPRNRRLSHLSGLRGSAEKSTAAKDISFPRFRASWPDWLSIIQRLPAAPAVISIIRSDSYSVWNPIWTYSRSLPIGTRSSPEYHEGRHGADVRIKKIIAFELHSLIVVNVTIVLRNQ